jgi:hypothetical protein
MSTEPAESSRDSGESKPPGISTEQARQILSKAPDATQLYLVATMPKRWYWPSAWSTAFVFALFPAIELTKIGVRCIRIGQPTHAAWYFPGALLLPLIALFAYFDVKRTVKGLTSDREYQKVLAVIMWLKLSAYLSLVYVLIWFLASDLSRAI